MPDIFEIGTRDYIRMSEAANCRLNIAHKIAGTEERQIVYNEMSLRMGKALEPEIIDFLHTKGWLFEFTGNEQLELGAQDPYRVGHPDGLVWIDPLDTIHPWTRSNVPPEILDALRSGIMLAEVKTMNDKNFRQFKKSGLAGGAFLKKYLDQITTYMGAMIDPSNDELYEDSEAFRGFLTSHEFQRPTDCLVIVFNTGRRNYGFEIVPFQQEWYESCSNELTELSDLLHQGIMPEPDYDGKAPDCHFCAFAWTCPAAQAVRADTLSTDFIPIESRDQGEEIDNACAAYLDQKALKDEIETNLTDHRDTIFRLVGAGNKMQTDVHKVSISQVKGRESLDTAALQDMINDLPEEHQFDIPKKRGNSYDRLNLKRLYGGDA